MHAHGSTIRDRPVVALSRSDADFAEYLHARQPGLVRMPTS